MGALSPMHWLIIVGVVVLLFGAKRLPDAARSVGRSARILKAEVQEMHSDTETGAAAEPAAVAPPAAVRPDLDQAPSVVVEAPTHAAPRRD